MKNEQQRLDCLIAQLQQETKTRNILSAMNASDGRAEQMVEKRKAEIRSRYGLSMDDSIKI